MSKASIRPTELKLHQKSRLLEVSFDDGSQFKLSCEYLRAHSPSAEVQGHGPSQKVLVAGKRDVNIAAIEPVGHYAVLLRFTDGHDTGIFSWGLLYDLGSRQEELWARYEQRLNEAGIDRDAPMNGGGGGGGGGGGCGHKH